MTRKSRYDKSQWMLARERLRLTDPRPPPSEPDLFLRPAIIKLFAKLDAQTGTDLHKIQTKWKNLAGETVAEHSCPGQLTDGILYVSVDCSTWLTEIKRFHADDILRRIQMELGAGMVKGMRWQVNPKECRLAWK